MKTPRETDPLLEDVLTDSEFRAALLDGTLRSVRRHRHWRQVRRIAAVTMLLGLAGLSVTRWFKSEPQSLHGAYELVATLPLPESMKVSTEPFAFVCSNDSVPAVQVVKTSPTERRFEIDDRELLQLAGTRPAVLVRLGPHSARLIFADEPYETGSPVN